MEKREYTAPTLKVIRLRTMTKLMENSVLGIGSKYNGTATIEDKDDDDSFGW